MCTATNSAIPTAPIREEWHTRLTTPRRVGAGGPAGGEQSFSAVSKPNFASKYACESSRRDLHNALLCTVLVGSVWVKKYTKISKLKFLFENR